MKNKKHLIILGSGSIGKRHANNLLDMGCRVSLFDPHVSRIDEAKRELDVIDVFQDINEALDKNNYDGAVICSPTKFHVDQAIQLLSYKIPILMEKPLGIDVATSEALVTRATASGIAHGVNFIFASAHPATQIEQALARAELGEIKGAEAQLHLPNWARRRYVEAPWLMESDQGGFVREVLSHFIYLTERLFGPAVVNNSHCRQGLRHGSTITGVVAELTCGDIPINVYGSTLGCGPDVCNYTVWGEHCSYRVYNLHGLQVTTGECWLDSNTADTDPASDWHQRQYDQLASMLDGQPHTLPDFASGLSVQRLIEGILEG